MTKIAPSSVGVTQPSQWRQRRRLSQLILALEAGISQKHLSFVESGRSIPSRDMVIRLSEALDIPLRERNAMLLAAGYAPHYLARPLDAPSLVPARAAIDLVLKGHEPFPALAIDRHWTMVAANAAVVALLGGVRDRKLLEPPVNVLRLSLHPDGLAPFIANLTEWRHHLFIRLGHQIAATADGALITLQKELQTYAVPNEDKGEAGLQAWGEVFVPMVLNMPFGTLSFFSATTVFGTPTDITLSEIDIEAFFPADEETRQLLQRYP